MENLFYFFLSKYYIETLRLPSDFFGGYTDFSMIFKHQFVFFPFVAVLFLIRFPAQCQALQDSLHILQLDRILIEVEYDLIADEPGLLFRITPYYIDSLDQKIPILEVRGDVGEGITAGTNKAFVWEYARELTQYLGPMKIAIEKDTLPPPATIILSKAQYRRGAKMRLKLEKPDHTSHYEIINSNRQIVSHGQLTKKQEDWQLSLPKRLSRSEIYRIRVGNLPDAPLYSSEFKVRRKIPLSTQIAGAALIVGGVLYLILKPETPHTLPPPYNLPEN